eukprot:3416036-Alexandrium_andersonii.AAC.1
MRLARPARRPPSQSPATPPEGFWPTPQPWPMPPGPFLARPQWTQAQAARGPPTPALGAGRPAGLAAAPC